MEDQLVEFFQIIEEEVDDLQFGTVTVNVVIDEGTPQFQTLAIVKSKRKKYAVKAIQPTEDDKESSIRAD